MHPINTAAAAAPLASSSNPNFEHEKPLANLEQLPELAAVQKAFISFSNGKESEAVFIMARMRYPQDRPMAMFADNDEEWPETYALQPPPVFWIPAL